MTKGREGEEKAFKVPATQTALPKLYGHALEFHPSFI